MAGSIIVIDGIATNRIMLKVQLSAAYYHVVPAERLEGIESLVRRVQPGLILCALSLPDGSAIDLRRRLSSDPKLENIPVIAVVGQNDRAGRLDALQAGIDEVLSQPISDAILQARIRALFRIRNTQSELANAAPAVPGGFAEADTRFERPNASQPASTARLVFLSGAAKRAQARCERLEKRGSFDARAVHPEQFRKIVSGGQPDVVAVDLPACGTGPGMNLLADLRSRNGTRNAAVIALTDPADPEQVAQALDRGADDAIPADVCDHELALRIGTQLRRKTLTDRMRSNLQAGLQAALTDPMTGLYNRRYALPQLAELVRQAGEQGTPVAVMLADLDHFKQINDRFGHQAGDEVLIETAARLGLHLRPDDVLARIGGEEFLILMPDVQPIEAMRAARNTCSAIKEAPFRSRHCDLPIRTTISIGLVMAHPGENGLPADPDQVIDRLLAQADRALYRAKQSGRNRVTMARPAA